MVEIITAVAIIALLAVLALPNFLRMRTIARQNACIANLRQVQESVRLWSLENKTEDQSVQCVWDDLIPEFMRKKPVCPCNGTYELGTTGNLPTCSYGNGHALGNEEEEL